MDNVIVQGAIEESLADNLNPIRFQRFLMDCLTSAITRRRGNAPEEVAILNNAELLQQIVDQYTTLYNGR